MQNQKYSTHKVSITQIDKLIEQLEDILDTYENINLQFAQAIYNTGDDSEFNPEGNMSHYEDNILATIKVFVKQINDLKKSRNTYLMKGLLADINNHMN